jgi:hypothetical protein
MHGVIFGPNGSIGKKGMLVNHVQAWLTEMNAKMGVPGMHHSIISAEKIR